MLVRSRILYSAVHTPLADYPPKSKDPTLLIRTHQCNSFAEFGLLPLQQAARQDSAGRLQSPPVPKPWQKEGNKNHHQIICPSRGKISQIGLTNSFLLQAAYSPGSGMRIDKVRSESKIHMSKIQGDLLCHAFLFPSVLRRGLADRGHGPDKFSQVVEGEPGVPPNPASPQF